VAETKIEWTATRAPDGTLVPGFTWNPWRGCTKVSPGCSNCYAETLSKRNPAVLGEWGPKGTRAIAAESYWKLPYRWNTLAAKDGVRRKVFCASLSDWLEDRPDLIRHRARMLGVVMNTDHLDWLLLTKRIDGWRERLKEVVAFAADDLTPEEQDGQYLARVWLYGVPPWNVWVGASAENQAWYDARRPHLAAVPARVRFWSMEPLLGPIALAPDDPSTWIITGGESGPDARPMDPRWAMAIRDQALARNTAYFHKQNGQWYAGEAQPSASYAGGAYITHASGGRTAIHGCRDLGGGWYAGRLSSKRDGGRKLDGQEWGAFPVPDGALPVTPCGGCG
jgi:protein gp37